MARIAFWCLLTFVASVAAAQTEPAPPTEPETPAQLVMIPVVVNTIAGPDLLLAFVDDDIYALPGDLTSQGLVEFAGIRREFEGRTFVSLKSLAPGIRYTFDDLALVLEINAEPKHFAASALDLTGSTPRGLELDDAVAYVNYGLNWSYGTPMTGVLESVLAYKKAFLHSTAIQTPEKKFVRGNTFLEFDRPNQMQRFIIGDTVVGADDGLGGGFAGAGFTVLRGFDLNPYFIRTPSVQGLAGAATTPSTIEVYANGALVRTQDVMPGPFDIRSVNVPVGRGNIRVVMRDAFGNRTEVDSTYYLSPTLLGEGFTDYQVSVGIPRQDQSRESFSYQLRPVALGSYRRGITPNLTLSGRLEGAQNLINGGGSIDFGTVAGAASIALAASGQSNLVGYAAASSYSYTGRMIGFGASARMFSENYANASLDLLSIKPFWETNIFGNVPLGQIVSVQTQLGLSSSHQNELSHLASVSLTASINKFANVVAIFTRNQQVTGKAVHEYFLSITRPLQGNAIVGGNVSYGQTLRGGVQLQKPLGTANGFGYRLDAQAARDQYQGNAQLQYQSTYGRYEATYLYGNTTEALSLHTAGSLALVRRRLYASRPIIGSFAVLHVPHAANALASVNNQPIARTDSKGYAFLPNLLPYYANRLSVDESELPFNLQIRQTELTATPQSYGGGQVDLEAYLVQSITGSLRLLAGTQTIVPMYGELIVIGPKGRPRSSPLGQDGEFYLENIPSGSHQARVEFNEYVCNFKLVVPATQQNFIQLGTLTCNLPNR